MLAKQGWRLLTEPDSLCARVLEAKYFPDGDVLTTQPKEGMSYTWRSILKGIEVLKQGVIKRVGDGASIKIWADPWIPRQWSQTPMIPRGQSILTTVNELIDPYGDTWDIQLVQQTFWPQDAEMILAMPIKAEMEDDWAWFYDPKGIFLVKSAYKVHRSMLTQGVPSSSSREVNHNQFTLMEIWKAPCAPKAKHHLWVLAIIASPHAGALNAKV